MTDFRTDWSPIYVAEQYAYPYGDTADTILIIGMMMNYLDWENPDA